MGKKLRMKTPMELLKELDRTTFKPDREFLATEVLCHIAMSLDKLVTVMCAPTYKIVKPKIDIESIKVKADRIFNKEGKDD